LGRYLPVADPLATKSPLPVLFEIVFGIELLAVSILERSSTNQNFEKGDAE
jgi:hypothetical protein